MPSAVICYALGDAELARDLTSFLNLNCAATVYAEEACIDPQHDLIDAAEHALSADYLLLLLSPDSVPAVWQRTRWEPVLIDEARRFGTQVAYVLLRPCKFPEVLRRNPFFDLSGHRLAGQRALKRWLLRQAPFFSRAIQLPEPSASGGIPAEDLDLLEHRLADQPGVQTGVNRDLALTFAHTHADDFEGAFWFNSANRSRAGMLGDTAQALDLKLGGTLEQNARALQEFCACRRLLLLFEQVAPPDRELVTFGGKVSSIFVVEDTNPVGRSLEETAALFSSWRNNFEACLSSLGDAQSHLRNLPQYGDEPGQIAISLGSSAYSCLKHAGRLAEAYEFLEWITNALRARGRPFSAADWEWERSWILEEWGEPVSRTTPNQPSQPVQLSLGLREL